jgi:glycine cleavage system transcriptional repressor
LNQWKMLTLVGSDQPGIVAQVTHVLYHQGWTLGETSMLRLGGNFTIMMMVAGAESNERLIEVMQPVAYRLHLHLHVDEISGGLHQHTLPNYQVQVVGADRVGIVAQVTAILAEADFTILELSSDVAGSEDEPVYIMTIQGRSLAELETLEKALKVLDKDVDVTVKPIEILFG